ncbi:MAG: hypothetical protein KJ072_16180 [Verrucomicrobia bacterium]|nr:hypothetical protein [Verrucomicrobiota bacterium]
MKNSGVSFLGLAFACAVILCFIDAVASSRAAAPAQAPEPQPPYEVALIDKSMTGGWTGEREFVNYLRETFGVSKTLKFKLRSPSFQDWLEKESPASAKVICLIDGWTSPSIARVEVRADTRGQELKWTFEVVHGDWKGALTRAKAYADAIR